MAPKPAKSVDSADAIEIIDSNGRASALEWTKSAKGFVLTVLLPQRVLIEMWAGGGGGGGATTWAMGGRGGGGGGAGQYKLTAAMLLPGKYLIEVGAGGRGGRAHQRNESDSPSQDGGDSFIRRKGGKVLVKAAGGKAGLKNKSRDKEIGDKGADVLGKNGQVLSKGGAGGPPDRPGQTGEPWGAGGGGAGIFRGPSNYFAGNGANGRVRIFR